MAGSRLDSPLLVGRTLPPVRGGPGGRTWHRFAWLTDGSWLAINLDHNQRDPRPKTASGWRYDPTRRAICHCTDRTQGRTGQNPVVAMSFTELLQRLLDSGGRPYWRDPRFVSYGDAEQCTRQS